MTLSWNAVHVRLKKQRGKASAHTCIKCPEPAKDWAYQYSAVVELSDERGALYSEDIWNDYAPMCRKCHVTFDRQTDERVRAIMSENGTRSFTAMWENYRDDPVFRENHSAQARANAVKARAAGEAARKADPEYNKRTTAAMVAAGKASRNGRRCRECGMVSGPAGIAIHQRAKGHVGIDNLQEGN